MPADEPTGGVASHGRRESFLIAVHGVVRIMWRSLFLALGVSTVILGVEALAVEKAVLKKPERAPAAAQVKVINPPEWAPWSLMAGGAVVILYSFTIPRRVNA